MRVDLGEHMWGEDVPFTLQFANHSDHPIRIKQVRPSCGCTMLAADLTGAAVESKGAVDLSGIINAEKNPGSKRRQIDLSLEDGRSFTAVLEMNVTGTWSISADELDLGRVNLDDVAQPPINRLVEFRSESDQLVGRPTVDVDWLVCRLSEPEPGKQQILLQAVPDKLRPGQNVATVIVRTSSTAKPDAVVLVRAAGYRELTPSPPCLIFVDEQEASARFYDQNGAVVQLARVTKCPPGFSAEVAEDGGIVVHRIMEQHKPDTVSEVGVVDSKGRNGTIEISMFH